MFLGVIVDVLAHYVLVDLGGLALYLRSSVPVRRILAAGAIIVVCATVSFVANLLAQYGDNVRDAISVQTLVSSLGIATSVRFNTIINPWITPPILLVLAIAGGAYLWRTADRRRAVFLLAWLTVFFVAHSFVRPVAVAMQARYHLHLATPFVMLAAAATPAILSLRNSVRIPLAVFVSLSPLIHLSFERDIDYSEMHEFAFLRDQRSRVASSCQVLEFTPVVSRSRPGARQASRVERMFTSLRAGYPDAGPAVVSLAAFESSNPREDDWESLTPAATDLLRSPAPCVYYYEGLACASHAPVAGQLAPACAAVHARARLRPVVSTSFQSRWYDDPISGRFVEALDGSTRVDGRFRDGTPVTLTLYRVEPGAP